MPQRSLTVGTVQVTAVCDVPGDFPGPLDQAFPGVEAAAWAPWRRRHPDVFSGPDRWRLRDWCFVVRARERVVLVDTGVGGEGVPGATWIGTPGRLPEELAAAGVEPDEIDLVVLTHLHLDHIGTRTPGPRSTTAWPRSSPSGWPSCWTATGSSTTSSAWSTPPGTPRARRACWSAPATTRPCSGATSPTTRPRSASPTGGRAATSSPRWPAVPGGGCSTGSRPRTCGWPRPTSRGRSAPGPGPGTA